VSAANGTVGRGILFGVTGPTRIVVQLGACACVLVACAVTPRAPGLWARSVEHVVAIDRDGTTREADGRVRVTTDLGFEVLVSRAYLVQSRAQLVDCLGVGGDVWDDWLALARLLGPSIAYAGHSDVTEPSTVIAPRAIDLVAGPDRAVFGSASFDEARYCRSHFLVAGVSEPIADAPRDVDLAGLTLYVEAEVVTPPRTITIASTLSDGALTDLPDALVGDLEGDHARLTVTRPLAHAFDGLALDDASLTDDAIARSALTQIDHEAVVTLEVTDGNEPEETP
jgi:hypothetical protein